MLQRMAKNITVNHWRQYNAAIKSGDLGIARSLAYRAISFHNDAGDLTHSGIWQRVLSNVFYLQGNYDQAVIEGRLALDAQNDPYERALTHIALGTFEIAVGEYDGAFRFFEKAAELGQAFADDAYLWTHLFGTRAVAYRRTGNLDAAI